MKAPFWLTLLPACVILQLGDFYTTYLGLTYHGHEEVNLAAAWIISKGWHTYLVVKILVAPLFFTVACFVTKFLAADIDREVTMTYTAIFWYAASMAVIVYNLLQYFV